MSLSVRDALTSQADHAALINQGPQVARAPDQRTEAVAVMHGLGSVACWPPGTRVLMHFLASPVLDLVVPAAGTFSMTIVV